VTSILFLVFLPLLAAAIAGFGNRMIGNVVAKSVTTGALFISCALAWPIFISYLTGAAGPIVTPVFDWINVGGMHVEWALRVDSLTAVMLVVVTSVSFLVHLYSWSYIAEDQD